MSEMKLVNAIKLDIGKERFDLIPVEPLRQLAQLYTVGAVKYEDNNWRKGLAWSRIFSAIMRHLWKFWKGEDVDEETGVPHVINAAWGCLTLAQYMVDRRKFDDRYKEKATLKFKNGSEFNMEN